MKSKKYYIEDIESHQLNEVTKGEKDAYDRHKRALSRLKKDGAPIGKVIIFGTAGEMEPGAFDKMWRDNG